MLENHSGREENNRLHLRSAHAESPRNREDTPRLLLHLRVGLETMARPRFYGMFLKPLMSFKCIKRGQTEHCLVEKRKQLYTVYLFVAMWNIKTLRYGAEEKSISKQLSICHS